MAKESGAAEIYVTAATVSGKGENVAIIKGDNSIGSNGNVAAVICTRIDKSLNIAVAKERLFQHRFRFSHLY
ncbi:MAG: hypothetical protein AAGF93_23830 [Cyanobacteria bacterium P01_H01_bin.105]